MCAQAGLSGCPVGIGGGAPPRAVHRSCRTGGDELRSSFLSLSCDALPSPALPAVVASHLGSLDVRGGEQRNLLTALQLASSQSWTRAPSAASYPSFAAPSRRSQARSRLGLTGSQRREAQTPGALSHNRPSAARLTNVQPARALSRPSSAAQALVVSLDKRSLGYQHPCSHPPSPPPSPPPTQPWSDPHDYRSSCSSFLSSWEELTHNLVWTIGRVKHNNRQNHEKRAPMACWASLGLVGALIWAPTSLRKTF